MLGAGTTLATPSTGHPLWHVAVVAGGAVAVFAVIKVREWRDQQRERQRNAVRVRVLLSQSPTVVMLALLSLVVALLHGNVTNEHFREAFLFGSFFFAMMCVQALWAALFILRPTRRLLVIAVIANSLIVMVWIASRTTGLPIGPTPWQPEPIGAIDIVCTLAELIICATALTLLTRTNSALPHVDATAYHEPSGAPMCVQHALDKRSAADLRR